MVFRKTDVPSQSLKSRRETGRVGREICLVKVLQYLRIGFDTRGEGGKKRFVDLLQYLFKSDSICIEDHFLSLLTLVQYLWYFQVTVRRG